MKKILLASLLFVLTAQGCTWGNGPLMKRVEAKRIACEEQYHGPWQYHCEHLSDEHQLMFGRNPLSRWLSSLGSPSSGGGKGPVFVYILN